MAAEGLILAEAGHLPAEKLRTLTETLVRQVAHDLIDTREAQTARLEQRDQRARSRRRLWFSPETDGSIEFGGSLPVVAGTRLQEMVQAVSDRSYRSAKDTHDRHALQENPRQRAADALVEILGVAQSSERGEATNGTVPSASAQIQVLIPVHRPPRPLTCRRAPRRRHHAVRG